MHIEDVEPGQWYTIVRGPEIPCPASGYEDLWRAKPRYDQRAAGFVIFVEAVELPFAVIECPGGTPPRGVIDLREVRLQRSTVAYRRKLLAALAAREHRDHRSAVVDCSGIDISSFFRP